MAGSHPAIVRCAPYLPVHDVDGAARHYRTVLGFSLEYAAGQPAEFAIVARDGHAIMLRRVPVDFPLLPVEKRGGTWDVFFWVRNLSDLSAELAGAGADFVYGVTLQEAYGMREFAVRDGDGYVLGFGEPVAA